MTLSDYIYKNLPRYYPTMYLDGYTPNQIREAASRDMIAEIEARQQKSEPEDYNIHITSEVKKK